MRATRSAPLRPASTSHPGRRSNGVAWSRAKITPIPREVVWGRSRAPAALASATNASVCRHSSGSAKVLVRLKVNGRPEARLMAAMSATSLRARSRPGPSPSNRGALPNAPRPWRPSTSASATSSRSPAQVPGTLRPSGATWRRVREVEKPTAPAAMASSTRATMAASSSSVGSAPSSRERSPMAW